MEEYLAPLIENLTSFKDPKKAAFSRMYLKDQFEFLGIETKTRREVLKNFLNDYGLPPVDQLKEFSFFLWNLPERDFQHIAIDVLDQMKKKLRKEDLQWLEQLLVQKSWWDTVDGLASWIIGTYFQLFPESIVPVTGKWMDSENMWLQRTSLIFQLKYKKKTDTVLLSDYIVRLADRKEFFIRKAIGWVLREYSKTNKQWVKGFIETHKLSTLSYREASKYV